MNASVICTLQAGSLCRTAVQDSPGQSYLLVPGSPDRLVKLHVSNCCTPRYIESSLLKLPVLLISLSIHATTYVYTAVNRLRGSPLLLRLPMMS